MGTRPRWTKKEQELMDSTIEFGEIGETLNMPTLQKLLPNRSKASIYTRVRKLRKKGHYPEFSPVEGIDWFSKQQDKTIVHLVKKGYGSREIASIMNVDFQKLRRRANTLLRRGKSVRRKNFYDPSKHDYILLRYALFDARGCLANKEYLMSRTNVSYATIARNLNRLRDEGKILVKPSGQINIRLALDHNPMVKSYNESNRFYKEGKTTK